jgi:hypothetical protein
MSNLAHLALLKAAFRAMGAKAKEAEAEVDACIMDAMATGGGTQARPALPDGTPCGVVSLVLTPPAPVESSHDILVSWLTANHPEALEEVTIPARTEIRVRPGFVAGLRVNGVHAVTPAGEEVLGMAVRNKPAYLSISKRNDDAVIAAILKARAGDELSPANLLALPEGDAA